MFSGVGRGTRDGRQREGREGMKKEMKKCYIHAPAPQNECKNYVL